MKAPILTIFSTPKPFTNPHIKIIQNNALTSWVNLGSEVETFLIGEEQGAEQAARQFGVHFYPQVRRNSLGTPLISSMFEVARQNSKSPFLAIVNTDVMLLPDCLASLKIASQRFKKFVLAGQRWDLAVPAELKFNAGFYDQLTIKVQESGRRHPPMGSDYFIFPRVCFVDVPDFAIGRAGWDNWMLFKGRFEGWPLIDATNGITAVHQDHDYSHLANGQPHYRLPETKQNVNLAGGDYTIFLLRDSTHHLLKNEIQPNSFTLKRFWREMEILPLTHWHSAKWGEIFYYLFHPLKAFLILRSKFRKIFTG
jgi:hypothetical protein